MCCGLFFRTHQLVLAPVAWSLIVCPCEEISTELFLRYDARMLMAIATTVLSQALPVPSYRQATDVAVITIEGVVDTVTAQSFKRRLEESSDADAIVIELNTPGGDLMSTLQICYEIKNNAQKNTVAWINPHAFSAGTIIA